MHTSREHSKNQMYRHAIWELIAEALVLYGLTLGYRAIHARFGQSLRGDRIVKALTALLPLMGVVALIATGGARTQPDVGPWSEVDWASAESEPLYRASHALIVAVSDYTAGWPDLPGVERDVELVQDALARHGFIVDVARNPTRRQFDAAMDTFIIRQCQNPEDRVVFYFLGHGATISNRSTKEEIGCVVLADAPLQSTNDSEFRSHAVNMARFEEYAELMQAKHVLFAFDSCFSGSVFTSDTMRGIPRYVLEKVRNPVRLFLSSGTAAEEVPDESVFSPLFARAIEGAADVNRDGYVSGIELGEFLQQHVIERTHEAQHPQYGKIKDFALDRGDIVFQVAINNRATVPVALNIAGPPRGSSSDDYVIAVMPFYGALPRAAEDGVVLKQFVERQLYDNLQDTRGVRIVRAGADQPVRSDSEARRAGHRVGASVVVWGEVAELGDQVEIEARVTRMPSFERLRHESRQLESRRRPGEYRDFISLGRLIAEHASRIAIHQAADYYQYIDPDRALELAEMINPPTAEILRLQAVVHWGANRDQMALTCVEAAVAADPDDVNLHILRARILDDMGEVTRSLDWLKTARKRFPASAFVLFQLGSIAYNGSRYEEAFKYYNAGLALDCGESYEACMRFGLAFARVGRYEEALKQYDRAATIDSGSAEVLYWSSQVYHALGNDTEAIRRVERARALSKWAAIGNQLGGLRIATGDYDDAIAILDETRAADPSDPYVAQNLANALMLSGRGDDAISLLRDAAERWPGLGQYRLFLHLALCREGRQDEAFSYLKEAIPSKAGDDVTSLIRELYANRLDEKVVVRRARMEDSYGDRLNRCELHYFLGMAYLVGASDRLADSAPDTARAIEHFKACLETEIYKFIEYDYAKAELRALGVGR